jgi:hypothetical protein
VALDWFVLDMQARCVGASGQAQSPDRTNWLFVLVDTVGKDKQHVAWWQRS